MTDTTISTTSTTGQTVRSIDRLFISASGNLKPSGTAVTWSLSTSSALTALIDNSGIIQSTGGRAFDTSGSASGAQNFSLINRAGAQIIGATDVMREQSNIGGGTMSIDNSGSITANNGRAFNIQEYVGLSSFTFTNRVGGTLQATSDGIRLTTAGAGSVTSGNNVFSGTINIDNSGTIKTVGVGSGQALDFNDINATSAGHVTITNRAGGVMEAADADAIRASCYADIENYGTIQAKNFSASSTGNDGVDFQTNDGGTVNNYQGGSIIGARHGITGNNPVTIGNDGAITGQLGSGINLDTASSTTTTIVNTSHGVITGTASGSTDGDGIDVDGLVNITNSGTIRALGHATSFVSPDTSVPLNEAITIGGGTITNNAGGLITSDERAITVDNSSGGNAYAATTIVNHGTITGANGEAIKLIDILGDTISNDGTINGSVVTGSAGDIVTNSGTINGTLSTGSGSDIVHWNSLVTGTVDGGAGSDTLTFAGTFGASSGSAAFTGFEAVSGSLTGTSGNDVLNFSALSVTGSLTVNGGDGNDSISGGSESDTINAGLGNDTLTGGAGNDTIDGGSGTDIAVFSGNFASYSATRVGSTVTLTGADGTDTVSNVETFQFGNGSFAVGQMGNVAPSLTGAQAVLAHGTEDLGYTISAASLLTGYTDANGDTLGLSGLAASNGTVTDNLNGTYTVAPTANFNGSVTLSYAVTDGNGGSTAAGIGYVVDSANDAPALTRAQAVLAHGTEDVSYIVSAVDLVAAFNDVDGDILGVVNLAATSGTVTDNFDGTYTIAPLANASGPVTLTYEVTDGHGGSTAASLSYSIDPVNDAPALTGTQAILANGTEDTGYTVSATDLLVGYADADGDTLGIRGLTASNGTVTDNHDGTYSVAPTADFNGTVTLSYSVLDDNGGATPASIAYALNAVNDAPTALTLSSNSIAENSANGTLVGTVSTSDVDDSSFTYSLLDNAGGRFAVDAHSGAVSVANGALLDFETAQHQLIDVEVKDSSGAMYHQQFTIDLTNVVENKHYIGTSGADIFTATSDDNWTVESKGGADIITTLGGTDIITSGAGNDSISTGNGDDLILIGKGAGLDAIDGGAGNDTILATAVNAVIGLSAMHGIETISSGGFAGVHIGGTGGNDVLDFSQTVLTGIQTIEGGLGNDSITGSTGNDTINGGAGADILAGGGGDDVFIFTAPGQSGIGVKADHILDFAAGDMINLSGIDANGKLAGDQAFTFIGTAAFSDLGQLRIGSDNGHVAIFGNISSNLNPDFEIVLDNNALLHGYDFIL